jgi:hypothetical protein
MAHQAHAKHTFWKQESTEVHVHNPPHIRQKAQSLKSPALAASNWSHSTDALPLNELMMALPPACWGKLPTFSTPYGAKSVPLQSLLLLLFTLSLLVS